MTWEKLAEKIAAMPKKHRQQQVKFLEPYDD